MQISYENFEDVHLTSSVSENILALRTVLGNTMDLNVMDIEINGVPCALVTIENMVSTDAMSELIFRPMMGLEGGEADTHEKIMDFIARRSLMTAERIMVYTFGETVLQLFSGFALIFVEGEDTAAALGIQGYDKKSISSPISENNVMGSQEAFAEVIRTNISLIRRRIKHPALRFEMMQTGKLSNTDICIAYIRGKADEKMLAEIRRRIGSIKLDSVFGAGYIRPFLEDDAAKRLFSEIGVTERPDKLCASLIEGRIAVLVDGTPFVMICPYTFAQYFSSMDDYASKSFFAWFLKFIRYFAFLLATAFPGIYLAAVNYNPEMLNMKLLANLSASEKTTILPLFSELVIIMLLLEVMREASIRLPSAVGTAMSIAGGLIIGDSAVKSGIISSPLLIIVGVTATASFVLPSFNQQTTALRLAFIIAGGFSGFFGITVCTVMSVANVCSQSFSDVVFTAPASPLIKDQLPNAFGRKSFMRMARDDTKMSDLTSPETPRRSGGR